MFARRPIVAPSSMVVVISFIALSGCAKPPAQPNVEQPPPPEATAVTTPAPQPAEMPVLPPPKLEEVQMAVRRIFRDAVVIDTGRKPSFLTGDFNGDLSQDLAIVVKPAEGKLSELNQEFPNWLAREPLKEVLLPKSKMLARPIAARSSPNPAAGQTTRFEQSDVLLAIVHGSGPAGWRDPEATQTHLLRDVVGANMTMLPLKSAVKAYKGIKPLPYIYGDLIQQTLIGQSGFLHFTGGMYGWYDPKNYRAGSVTGHAGMTGMK